MDRSVRRHWEELARENALGAILTGEGGTLRDWSLEEFYATGRADIADFVHRLDQLAPDAPRGRALDFGCGVGRLTRALAEIAGSVVGVDAAPTMIRRARALNADRPQCRFVLNRASHLRRFGDGSFDLIYSRLVLQHIPPQIVHRYIPEMVRVLAASGVLMFQLPEPIEDDAEGAFCRAPVTGSAIKRTLPRWIVDPYRRLKFRVIMRKRRGMRMFGIRQTEVLALIGSAGGRILAIDEDRGHGTEHNGYAYWVTK